MLPSTRESTNPSTGVRWADERSAPGFNRGLSCLGPRPAIWSLTASRSLLSERPFEESLLTVQSVLRLPPHQALRPLDHLVRDLLAAVSGKAMQHDGLGVRGGHQRAIHAEAGEGAAAHLGLFFLTHRREDIGRDDVATGHRLLGRA